MSAPTAESADDGGGASTRSGTARAVELGAVETSGLTIRPLPDGTVVATAERVAVRQLRARTEWGAFHIAEAVLTGVLARLSKSSPARGPELIELSASDVRVERMDGIVNKLPSLARAQSGAFDVDALADIEGVVRAFVTDALWIIDAEVVIPVAQGRIDLDRVIVEHVGPNSTMSIGARGIHVDAPHRARIDLFTFGSADVPGVRAHGRDRGRLELAPFVQAVLAAPAGQPVARLADARLDGAIQRTRLSGELRMGDGALGTAMHRIVLRGREQGRNRIELSSLAVGQRVIVRAPELVAESAAFEVAGNVVTTGQLSAALEVHLIDLHGNASSGGGSSAVAVAIHHAALARVDIARR